MPEGTDKLARLKTTLADRYRVDCEFGPPSRVNNLLRDLSTGFSRYLNRPRDRVRKS